MHMQYFFELNVAIRPHPTMPKSRSRKIFEIIHKGGGRFAVVLGCLNIMYGIKLIIDKGYDVATISVPVSLVLSAWPELYRHPIISSRVGYA